MTATVGASVKLVSEYIERATQLEALAEGETNLRFKAELLKQAASYRKLAASRAEKHSLPPPSALEESN